MNDQWTKADGTPVPSDWDMGLPLSDDWILECGCDGPNTKTSIVDNVTITGSPGSITSVAGGKNLWSVVLNDGTPQADFAIERFDDAGQLVDSPMTIVRATGVVTFHDPVMLARDPVEPMEAVTLEFLEGYPSGIPEAPDNQTYGRTEGAWNLVVPAAGGTFTGQTNLGAGGAVTSGALVFAGNAVCSVPTVAQLQIGGGSAGQVPATDGNGNLSWVTPVTGGPYLPLSGGTVSGNLTVTGIMSVNGPNSMVLNAAPGNQRAILGQSSGLTRWQLQLGDQTAEGAGNAGSNFSLSAYALTGTPIGTWLSIARADGSTVFNGTGVTIQGGLAVNGTLALAGPGNLAMYGGTNGQVLTTNGSGILSWATPAAGGGGIPEAPTDGQLYGRQSSAWHVVPAGGGGIADAPNDGTAYARKSLAWSHLTHTDITDWAANVPAASTTTPLMDGTAAVGTGTTFARADHVHPSDTSRYAASNPAGYQTAAQVTAVLPVASSTLPLAAGTAAVGTGTTWARADHVHPGGGSAVTIGDTAPASPAVGALWWDSVGGQMYLRYQDPNTTQWVPTTNAASLPPPASTTVLGSVKVDGTSIKAASDGTISTVLVPMGDNRIINGDFRIDQRWGGASSTNPNPGYTVDRWWFYSSPTTSKGTWGRNFGALPSLTGFPYYWGFQSSSAYTPVAADQISLGQSIEADMVSDFAWGTASAQPVTLSFWACSSLTGSFSGSINNADGTRGYPFSFSIPAANTWTKIALTIPGDTTGTWPMSGNAASIVVNFDLGSGATARGAAGAWANGYLLGVTGAVQVVQTNAAKFGVTGVKLEIGSIATPYNRQSLAKSMADCQRYYQKLGGVSATDILVQGYAAGAAGAIGISVGINAMRAAPTATRVGTWGLGNVNASAIATSNNTISLQLTATAAGLTSLYTQDTTTYLTLSAEI
jgi:hypothetical protein